MSARNEPLEVIGFCDQMQRTTSPRAPASRQRFAYNITIELSAEDAERIGCGSRLKVILPPLPKSPGERLFDLHYAHRQRFGLSGPAFNWAHSTHDYRSAWETTAEALSFK